MEIQRDRELEGRDRGTLIQRNRDRKSDENPEQSWVAQLVIKSRVISGYENCQKLHHNSVVCNYHEGLFSEL